MGMSDRKIKSVLDRYQTRLEELMSANDDARSATGIRDDQIQHAQGMIPKMHAFLKEGRREKAFRWLGFLQGVLYSNGIYTIDEMANHSRPTKQDYKADFPEHAFLDGCPCVNCKEYLEAPDAPPA